MKYAQRIARNAQRSFTLIELLIASSIFAVVMLSVYAAFRSGMLVYRKIDTDSETYRSARVFFSKIESDLKNSFIYGDANGSRFKGEATELEFFNVIDFWREDELSTNIYRVKYVWDKGSGVIKRTTFLGLDALKPETDVEAESQDLAQGAEKLTFEYAYLTVDTDNKTYVAWQDIWPIDDAAKKPTQEKSLPSAVRIKLTISGIEFIKLVPLPLGEKGESSA